MELRMSPKILIVSFLVMFTLHCCSTVACAEGQVFKNGLLNSEEINHEYFMMEAIKEALKIKKSKERRVGSVVVENGKIIARGYNTIHLNNDPIGHAEINAIRKACKIKKMPRLNGCIIYSTLQPCPLCLTAIIFSGISIVVYGQDAVRRSGPD